MKTYKLPLSQITEVQGEFISFTSDSEFVYIHSETKLQKPFIESEPPAYYLEALKEELNFSKQKAIREMNQICDKHLEKLTSNALGKPHIYDMTQEDQINLMGIILAGIDSFFRCATLSDPFNKQNIPHTKEQFKQLYNDALNYKAQILFKCGVLKDKINQAQSIEAVEAIEWIDEEESKEIQEITDKQETKDDRESK
ncbi:hypothetical protein BKH41_02965 [Helicobacter sp. 12S02232-10]|uniref:DUF4376 domain-containing protein n=1 Tax=Helicobacter sp. 12S02232-10 TaxID=1476197 RepID=UPI000BA5FF3A|nr:hypothetical protein [Helicobacter sp. 12S02232-10]PAF49067.1 hypothetical protein BKH41_02965 [Helicobacter sp. 12S02232-10]